VELHTVESHSECVLGHRLVVLHDTGDLVVCSARGVTCSLQPSEVIAWLVTASMLMALADTGRPQLG